MQHLISTKFNSDSPDWLFQISGTFYTVDSLDVAIQALRSLVVSDCHFNWEMSFIDCCQSRINLTKQHCLIHGFYGESNWYIAHRSMLVKLAPTKIPYNHVDLIKVCVAITEYDTQQEILQTDYTWNLIETFVNHAVLLLLGQAKESSADDRLQILCDVLASRPPAENLVLLDNGHINVNTWKSHFYAQALDLIATWDENHSKHHKVISYLAKTLNLEITDYLYPLADTAS